LSLFSDRGFTEHVETKPTGCLPEHDEKLELTEKLLGTRGRATEPSLAAPFFTFESTLFAVA
jgi:hypothetical protein